MKRFITVLTALALMFTCFTARAADSPSADNFAPRCTYTEDTFSDTVENEWYGADGSAVVKTAFELGIMNGYPDGSFLPDSGLRVSEAVKMAAVAHSIYAGDGAVFDVSKHPWYLDHLNYALGKGLISAGDFTDFDVPASRADLAYIFRNVLPASELPEINTVNSVYGASLGMPKAGSILLFLRAGVFDGTVSRLPGASVSRAEAAAFASKLALKDMRCRFEVLPKNGDAAYHIEFSAVAASGRILALGYQGAYALPQAQPLSVEKERFMYGTDSFYSTYENFGSIKYLRASDGIYVYGIYLTSPDYSLPNGIRCGIGSGELLTVYGDKLIYTETMPGFGGAHVPGEGSPWCTAVFNIEDGRVVEIILLCSVE